MLHRTDIAVRMADTAAGGAIVTAIGLSIADIDHLVSIGAGVVAIIAGLCAAWYHWKKAREIGRK